MVVDNTGNVGIGTTSPGALLTVGPGGTGTTQSNYLRINGGSGVNSWFGMSFHSNGVQKGQVYYDLTTDQVRLASSATDPALSIASNGNVIVNSGNVGIGTTGPGEKLHIYSATASVKAILESGLSTGTASVKTKSDTGKEFKFGIAGSAFGGYYGIAADDGYVLSDVAGSSFAISVANAIRLYTGSGTLGLVQSSTGNVGIGNVSPSSTLHITGTLQSTATTTLASLGGDVLLPGTGVWKSTGNVGIGTQAPSTTLHVVGTARTTATTTLATAGGNVGIGTTSPGALLHINKSMGTSATADTIRLERGTTGAGAVDLGVGYGGYLSIVPDSIDYAFLVRDSAATANYWITSGVYEVGTANQGDGFFKTYSDFHIDTNNSATPKVTVTTDGNVGIGTTSPSSTLHVYGGDKPTIYVGSNTKAGCIVMGDEDAAGVTYLTTLDGVLNATTTKPSVCQ